MCAKKYHSRPDSSSQQPILCAIAGETQSGSHQITLEFVQPGDLLHVCRTSVGWVPHFPVGAPLTSPSSMFRYQQQCAQSKQERSISSPSLALALTQNHNNNLGSRPINTNSRQCSSFARRVRLFHSRSCARTLMTDD